MPDIWTPFIRINYAYSDGIETVDALVLAQIDEARRLRSRATGSDRRTAAIAERGT